MPSITVELSDTEFFSVGDAVRAMTAVVSEEVNVPPQAVRISIHHYDARTEASGGVLLSEIDPTDYAIRMNITIQLVAGRGSDSRATLARRLCDVLTKQTNCQADNIRMLFVEHELDAVAIGGTLRSESTNFGLDAVIRNGVES